MEDDQKNYGIFNQNNLNSYSNGDDPNCTTVATYPVRMQQWLAGTGRVLERAVGLEGGWAHSGQPAGPAGSQHGQLTGLNSKHYGKFWASTR